MMKKGVLFYLAGMSVSIASYDLVIELPRIKTSEYYRPYLASWVEDEGRKHVGNLGLWYDVDDGGDYGERWLKNIRKWWRVSGRDLELPVEGLSSPTKPPGVHRLSLNKFLSTLPADKEKMYKIYVEVARELGGRELVSIPFKWDGKVITFVDGASKNGKKELGKIEILLSKKKKNVK